MILSLDNNVVIMSTLGDYIMKLRTQKGLTQRDLAKKAGFSHGTLQKIESGATLHPGIDVLIGISKALRVDVIKLIRAYEGEDPDTPSPVGSQGMELLREIVSMLPDEVVLDALSRRLSDDEKKEFKRKFLEKNQ